MKRRIISICLMLCVLLSAFALNVFAAPNEDGYGMVANTIDMATTWVRYLGAIAAVYGLTE